MSQPAPKYLLTSVVTLGLVLGVAGGWLLQHSRRVATQAVAALEQKKQERDRLVRQSPALSPGNEAAITADLAATERVLAEMQQVLQGKEAGLLAAPAPGQSIDAFFALADFIGQLRVRAAQAQVGLKPDERFGFATHTHEGPAVGQLATVHRQRLGAQYLVETLLESHPRALLAVRRERPLADGPSGSAEDFFELARPLSLREPGQVEGEAFRLEFTGQTAALRNFLNSLASFRQPVVVRSVEVEPLAVAAPSVASVTPGLPVPLVKPGLSKFTVVVEFALLAINPVNTAP